MEFVKFYVDVIKCLCPDYNAGYFTNNSGLRNLHGFQGCLTWASHRIYVADRQAAHRNPIGQMEKCYQSMKVELESKQT